MWMSQGPSDIYLGFFNFHLEYKPTEVTEIP